MYHLRLFYFYSWYMGDTVGMDYQKNKIDASILPKIFQEMSYGVNNYETKNGVVSHFIILLL